MLAHQRIFAVAAYLYGILKNRFLFISFYKNGVFRSAVSLQQKNGKGKVTAMIEIARASVMNMENALRGARNPLNSWARSDSGYDENGAYRLGENDLGLARRLCRAGSDHRKFLRQILVSADITAPLYWWKEFDTYKVGTVANSTSTMHKIHSQPFAAEQFSCDRMSAETRAVLDGLITHLESLRLRFVETKDKAYWDDIIQLLPSSYNQLRTCTMNYENLLNMYRARKNHKLAEWRVYCDWIATLPYAADLITFSPEGQGVAGE